MSKHHKKAHIEDSRAEDDLKVRVAMVADRISRAADLHLLWFGPPLAQWAVPGEASLTGTLLGAFAIRDGIRAEADITVAAFHERKVVSSTFHTSVLAVAKLKKSLRFPLPGSAPFGMAREPHAYIFVRSGDGELLLW